MRMKPSVSDFWFSTPLHFFNAGEQGCHHFNFFMNIVSVKELSTVLALLLYKGHSALFFPADLRVLPAGNIQI